MNKRLTVLGRIPSKKNSRINFVRNGRVMSIPSTKYQAWHKNASKDLSVPVKPIQNIIQVTLSFYAPDRRKADLTNKAESVMDLMVDNNILEDDNWYIVRNVVLRFIEVDKENPRCEVDITYGELESGNC